MKNGLNIFRYLVHDFWEKKGYSIHIVSYGNNGYYNWHSDGGIYYNGLGLPALWTFALTLIKDPSKVSGGDQLIMEKDKTIRIPLENNSLVIFPSYTFHSMTEIKSIDNNELPWENRRFNIQFWTTILPKFEDEIVQEIPY